MQQADSLEKAVRTEQEMMEPLRQRADVVIDTTHLSTAQLRGELLRHFGSDTTEKGGMSVTITSFGFKYGLPMEADLVFDVALYAEPLLHPGAAGKDRFGSASGGLCVFLPPDP